MPYRKVSALEQCWYLLKYKIEELLGADHRNQGCKVTFFQVEGMPNVFIVKERGDKSDD